MLDGLYTAKSENEEGSSMAEKAGISSRGIATLCLITNTLCVTKHLKPKIFVSSILFVWNLRKS